MKEGAAAAFLFPAQSRPENAEDGASCTPLGAPGRRSGRARDEGKKSHFRVCHLDWLPLSLSLGAICMRGGEEDEVVTFSAFLRRDSTFCVIGKK